MPIATVMTSGEFFIQTPDDARRHVTALAQGLKKVGIAGLVGGAGCGVIAVLLGRMLTIQPQSDQVPGFHEISGVTFVAGFMAISLIVFSGLYVIASFGLSQQKSWGRNTAAGTFLAKVLLCVWLGRGSVVAMVLFLLVAVWDLYGLWVLLSKETGQLFSSPESNQATVKPANLVT